MNMIGDRVKLVETELQGVVIGKNLGNVRYKVRCDDGALAVTPTTERDAGGSFHASASLWRRA